MSNLFTQIAQAAEEQQKQLNQSRIEKQRPEGDESNRKIESTNQTSTNKSRKGQAAGQPDTQTPRRSDKKTDKKSKSSISESLSMAKIVPFEPDTLNVNPLLEKATYEITESQLDFVNRTNFELRKWKIHKRDIVQTAIELLEKDYQQNALNSYLMRKFKSHKPFDKVS